MKKTNDYLRDFRFDLGVSQETMAENIGVSQSTYNRIENGKRKINMDDLDKIAKATGKDKKELFEKLVGGGITVKNTINNAHDNQSVVNIANDEYFHLLLEEKEKRIFEKEEQLLEYKKIIEDQKNLLETILNKL